MNQDDDRIVKPRQVLPDKPGKDRTPEISLTIALQRAEMARKDGYGDYVPTAKLKTTSDLIQCAAVRLGREVEKLQRTRGCLRSDAGRGDCHNFVGIPSTLEHPTTIDHYGRPHGWCQVCWQSERISVLEAEYKKLIGDFDQSEKENKAYNAVFSGLRGQLANGARELADWCDNQKAKELGK